MEFLFLDLFSDETSGDVVGNCRIVCDGKCIINISNGVDVEKGDMAANIFSICRIDMHCPQNVVIL